jgi:dipeptidyl aminopeptidase/acylaminoacyl peptidase
MMKSLSIGSFLTRVLNKEWGFFEKSIVFIFLCTYLCNLRAEAAEILPSITFAEELQNEDLTAMATHPDSDKIIEMPLIPRRLLFGSPEKTMPRISADGKKLAYLAPDENNISNVWVVALDQPRSPKKITQESKRGVRHFSWQYDFVHILYIQDKDGDENWHLYQTHIETGETIDLTPYENVSVVINAYSPLFPDELLIQMNYPDPHLYHIYRLNLQTHQIKLDTENSGEVFHFVADHDLHIRATQEYEKNGFLKICVRDTVQSPWRELLTLSPEDNEGMIIGFSSEGQSLYFLSSIGTSTCHLSLMDFTTAERSLIYADGLYDITHERREQLSNILINSLTHRLEVLFINKERYEAVALDPQFEPDLEFLRNILDCFIIVDRDLKNEQWLVAALSDRSVNQYYLYHRLDRRLQLLFNTQPTLDNYLHSPMRPISFIARDGMLLYGYLTLPVNKTPSNLPLVLLVHGGPWVRDSWGFNPQVQWLANRGYAVLQVNYRGSTGYGKQYLRAGNREWGRKMHTDLLDAKQWIINEGIVDPQKVAIFGGSYGGYATLVGLAFTPEEFCCGVDVVGPSNLITLLQTIPPYWTAVSTLMKQRVGDLDTDMEFLKERSPLFKAHQITKPLLIAQGANDPRVKQAESDQIVHAMRQNNLLVDYLLFRDEGHGFAKPENRLKFFAAAEAFLAQHLGGLQELPALEENWDALKS